eukprot:9048539-Ditylum_brightwellii.AAC.1
MVEEGPWPVLAWEIPSKEVATEWREKVCKHNDGENRPEGVAYLKEKCNDYVRINFVKEVPQWRINCSWSKKMERARTLVTAYFMLREIDKTTGKPTLWPKTEIEENELKQKLPS